MLITNGRIVTFGAANEIIENGAVRVQGDRITDLGPAGKLQQAYPADEVVDAAGRLVMPGNICAHTHFYGAFARGMAIPGEPPRDFPEILGKLWWRLDRALLDLDVKYSALVCLVDAIKHGTTTLIDHHASPAAIHGSLDQIAEAVTQAGVRASLCYEVTDRNGPAEAREGIDENVRFLHAVKEMNNPLLAASFGMHASLTLSDETLADCVAAAEGLDERRRAFTSTRPRRSRTRRTACANRASGWWSGCTTPASWGRAASWPTASTWTPGRWRSCATPALGSCTSRAPT